MLLVFVGLSYSVDFLANIYVPSAATRLFAISHFLVQKSRMDMQNACSLQFCSTAFTDAPVFLKRRHNLLISRFLSAHHPSTTAIWVVVVVALETIIIYWKIFTTLQGTTTKSFCNNISSSSIIITGGKRYTFDSNSISTSILLHRQPHIKLKQKEALAQKRPQN